MTALQNAIAALNKLTSIEKAQVLQSLVMQLTDQFPGISRQAGVCGGAACVEGTRVPVWTLHHLRNLGFSNNQLLEQYPTLTQQDLKQAFAYADLHIEEIEQLIGENLNEI